MTVPTTQEFDSWLQAALLQIEPKYEIPDPDATAEPEQGVAYLRACYVANAARRRQLKKLPVGKWLEGQREYRRAYDLVFGRKKRSPSASKPGDVNGRISMTVDDLARAEYGDLVRLFSRPQAAKRVPWARLQETRIRSLQGTWQVACVKALHEYREGLAPEAMLASAREVKQAVADLHRAFDRYERHAKVLAELELPTCPVGSPLSVSHIIRSQLRSPDLSRLPMQRLESRSPERLFVYRMWWANHLVAESPKPEAISSLMQLEGFDHQYDVRTINRQCSEFTGIKDPKIRSLASW